jgi:hypothetical protein
MNDLISINEYKDLQRMDLAKTENDEQLEIIIRGVSQLVKTYCSNSFIDYVGIDKVELFTLNFDQHHIQLSETPTISISRITERANASKDHSVDSDVTILVTGQDYAIDKSTDMVYRMNSSGQYLPWQMGVESVSITYRAGYYESAGIGKIPNDLHLAVSDLVTYYYKDQTKSRQTIAGASLQVNPSSSQRNSIDFPDHIKRVLDLYKN